MNLEQRVSGLIKREVAGDQHAHLYREPLVGFSAAADPLYASLPEIVAGGCLRPREILPEAETVISFFVPFSAFVVHSNRRDREVSREWCFAYIECNKMLDRIAKRLADYLTRPGHKAVMIGTTDDAYYNPQTLGAAWSNKSAAFIAGLGRFGLNRMLITSRGCAGHFGCVITSKKFTPSRRSMSELCLYFQNGRCGACLKSCPTQALAEKDFDRGQCNEYLLKVNDRFPDLEMCDVCGKCVAGPCAIW